MEHEEDTSPTDTASSTLAVVDPVTRRVSGILRELGLTIASMPNRDFLGRQVTIILDAIREELEQDSHLFDNQSGHAYLFMFAELIKWTVTGDTENLPEPVKPIAYSIEGKTRTELHNAHS